MAALSAVGDLTLGEYVGCKLIPTPIMDGSPTVFVNGKAVATVGSKVFPHFCFRPNPNGPGEQLVAHRKRIIITGSPTVFINGKPAATIGSKIFAIPTPPNVPCTDTIVQGSPTVFVPI